MYRWNHDRLAGMLEVVYRPSTALATRRLGISRSRLGGDRAGVVGASVMVLERNLSAAAVDRSLEASRAGALPGRPVASLGRS